MIENRYITTMPRSPHTLSPLTTMAAALAAAIASLLVLSTLATAVPYTIDTCGNTGKIGGWHTTGSTAGWIDTGARCPAVDNDPDPNSSAYRDGIYVTDTLATRTDTPQGSEAGWQFDAPAGTTIMRLQYWHALRKQDDNNWNLYFKLGTADGAGTILDSCTILAGNSACGGSTGEWGWGGGTDDSSYTDVSSISTSALSFGLRCAAGAQFPCLNGYSIYHARALLYEAKITIDDPTAPTTPTATGEGWTSTSWTSGTIPVTVSGTDPESGIQGTRIYVDGQLASTLPGTCDWTMPTPCTNASNLVQQLDTTQLTNGSHSLQLADVNAAGVETRITRPTPLLVDNAAPTTPASFAAVRRGDSDVFDVSWQLPTDAGAPIVAARYQLCSATCGAVQNAGALTHVDGLPLPSTTDYTLHVWLTDQLGNEDASSAATTRLAYHPPHIDPPSTTPTPTPTTPTPTTPTPPTPTPRTPTPPTPTPAPALRATNATLRVAAVQQASRRIVVRGTLARAAQGRVAIAYAVRTGHRTLRAKTNARIAAGRFAVTLRLPRTLSLAASGLLTISYGGSPRVHAASLARTLRRPCTLRR